MRRAGQAGGDRPVPQGRRQRRGDSGGAEKAETAADCQKLFREAADKARDARLLVLDEAIDATYGFLPMGELTAFLDSRPEQLEVVITGHSLPGALAERAGYISHVEKEKHPYDQGVMARPDIEF